MSLLTLEEYADQSGKSVKTVEYQLRVGQLKFVKKYGKRLIDSRTKYPKRVKQGRGLEK
jgi:hypothetical protein